MPMLLGVGLLAAFATTAPWPTLLLVGFAYLGSIPFTMRAAIRARRAAEAKKPEPAGAPVLLAAPARSAPVGDAAVPRSEWRH
jgi:CDP-diacylglycerol--serine O-phosphatidyltransferase